MKFIKLRAPKTLRLHLLIYQGKEKNNNSRLTMKFMKLRAPKTLRLHFLIYQGDKIKERQGK